MKSWMMMAAVCAAAAAVAADVAVSPMKVNFLKEASFDDQIVSGISVPGGSVDFPLNGQNFDASAFNQAKLTIEAVEGGIAPEAPDMYLNLRSADKAKPQVHVVGAAGRNPGEVYFYFTGAPADVNMMRLYLDVSKRNNGKKFAFKIKSLSFDKIDKGEVFLAYSQNTINNCDKSLIAAPVFSGTPKNNGCSVIFFAQPKTTFFKDLKFSKAEVGYTMIKGKLSEEGVEFNPRRADNSGAEVRDPESAEGKFTFELDEPFSGFSRLFFYFNRDNALTGKEVQFKINYIALIP